MDDISSKYPAVGFVKYLLLNISRRCGVEFVLDEQTDMAQITGQQASEFPPLENIVNRLKVMSGFDPIYFPEVKEGVIRLKIGADNGTAYKIDVAVRFDDVRKVVYMMANTAKSAEI